MIRVFVAVIVLSMVAAGILSSLPASVAEEVKAKGIDKKDIWKSEERVSEKGDVDKPDKAERIINIIKEIRTGKTIGAGQVIEIIK